MRFYETEHGLRSVFEKRFEEKKDEFPNNCYNLVNVFHNLEEKLNNEIHKNVNAGAAVHGDGMLTDHGVDHIKMVMDKAYHILGKKVDDLIGYEIFLLLLAIHFHDVGNISGRDEHEQKISEIIGNRKDLGIDNAVEEIVTSIATAHGGYADLDHTNKDTLQKVEEDNPDNACNGLLVRATVLAAILRFADELSDDYTRATIPLDQVPEENRIFHAYSKALEPILINGGTVVFKYRIPFDQIQTPFIKCGKETYLYDEIHARLLKCLKELDYCRRYADGFISIKELSVHIKFISKNNKTIDQDSFKLRVCGYPSDEYKKIEQYSVGKSPKYVNGIALMNSFRESAE